MSENFGGLGFKGSENNGKTIYVELKPDSLLVRRLENQAADDVFKKRADGTLESNFQVRTLEMGKDKGKEVAEQIFDEISNVQLIKAYSEVTKWNAHRMVLVFNNMQEDSPNINVQCPLISDHNSVNGYASNFIDKIPNIEIGTPMTIETWKFYDKKKGKDRRGITIYQNNEKVQSAYYDYKNNKRIGDKPSAIVGTKLGSNEPSYDFTPVSEFQLEKFKDFSESLKNYWSNGEEAKSKAVEVEEEAMPF